MRARIQELDIDESAEATISEYIHKLNKFAFRRLAQTRDIDRKRHMPPAWDPPELLLVVVSGLHVVVGTSSVVGVIVDGGVWLLDSSIWFATTKKKGKGGKGGEKQP